MRLLTLVTDAFGGRGGIAKFNRDLLTALCAHPDVKEVVALPRLVPNPPGSLPDELAYRTGSAGSKLQYAWHVARSALNAPRSTFDGVICGHLHLLPFAWAAARWQRAPLLLVIHGLEARKPSARWLSNALVPRIDHFVVVSQFTKERFLSWTGLPDEKGTVVPNCIDASRYGPGSKPAYLLDRYGLEGRTVLLTLSRLPVQDLRKGHDEVLEVLPDLAKEVPDLAYLVCGDGDDRPRLEAEVRRLGLSERVVFAGYVPEEEKADHYRLADAFVMPGRTEGFGIVYLEALACGVPVVASSADASQEAVRGGELGVVVDPDDPADLKRGIRSALEAERGVVPKGLDYFSFECFQARWHDMIRQVFT